jgi:ferredoxin-NADP reductase/nitrite reductase/ring-hydroxylating ferredoxin subunit
MSDQEYTPVANQKDLQDGHLLKVDVFGKPVVLSKVNGKIYALDAVCSHEGGPLEDGTLDGFEIECPWHGSRFDIRTGEVTSPPAEIAQLAYEVKLEGDKILVKNKPEAEEEKKASKSPPEHELVLLQKEKVQETDMMSLKFGIETKQNQTAQPEAPFNYTAGQYAYFDIGGVNNDPKGPIRHFTISSSPTESWIMLTTRIRDSPYKKRLSSLQDGVKVKVRGPEGKFVLHDDQSKPAIFLSGGIGVTPFRSMIKYATDKQLPIKIVMFDSNRNQQNIIFKEEFDECTNKNKNLKVIYTITDEDNTKSSFASASTSNPWTGERGRINKEMINKHLNQNDVNNSIFYVCGPPAMLNTMKSILENDLKITQDRIKVEEFTGY